MRSGADCLGKVTHTAKCGWMLANRKNKRLLRKKLYHRTGEKSLFCMLPLFPLPSLFLHSYIFSNFFTVRFPHFMMWFTFKYSIIIGLAKMISWVLSICHWKMSQFQVECLNVCDCVCECDCECMWVTEREREKWACVKWLLTACIFMLACTSS